MTVATILEKRCMRCLQVLPISNYYLVQTRNGYNSRCKSCVAISNKEYRAIDPENTKAWDRRRHLRSSLKRKGVGINLEEYNALLTSQKGLCAICQQPERYTFRGTLRSLAVDHCHKTNIVRELLCARCNLAIGLLEDDPELLAKCRDYLLSHRN